MISLKTNKIPPQASGEMGLLYSQIGYEPNKSIRNIVQMPESNLIPINSECKLKSNELKASYTTPCKYWGQVWGSHWWIADYDYSIKEGVYTVAIIENLAILLQDDGLTVKAAVLKDSTLKWSSIDMLERRRHFTGLGVGWQDAGTLWVESPAQSAMIMALCEVLEKCSSLNADFTDRIYEQLMVGCDYLVLTHNKSKEIKPGFNAFSHDLYGHQKDLLPNDASKSILALSMTSRLLSAKYKAKKEFHFDISRKAYNWIINKAKPVVNMDFSLIQKGLNPETPIPDNEWQTRDLLHFCAASIGIWKNGIIKMTKLCREHKAFSKWKQLLLNFTNGYLISACSSSPFLIAPQGIFKGQEPIWLSGTFHGTNAIYAYTAALDSELFDMFKIPMLKNPAINSLLWIAGLNSGLTKKALKKGCVVFHTDIEEGIALPVSMICGIGKRWAGTCFQTRSVICNGFTIGEQFKDDTFPKTANDIPSSFRDEDWIPYCAA